MSRQVIIRSEKNGQKVRPRKIRYAKNGSRYMIWHGWNATLRRVVKNNRRAEYYITKLSCS